MKRKDKLGVELERQNADDTSLRSEDESATTGDDSPEFNVMQPATEMPANIEKAYSATDTPEEIYAAEQLMNKHNSIGERVTAKEEMEELARLREEQEENPVNQSPAARLPPQSLPPRSPPSVPGQVPPQIPGAATQPRPQEPLNPFAQPQQPAKPESGLPWKPPGGKGVRKHDCLTVHGYQKHEEWEAEQEKKFFRSHKTAYRRT